MKKILELIALTEKRREGFVDFGIMASLEEKITDLLGGKVSVDYDNLKTICDIAPRYAEYLISRLYDMVSIPKELYSRLITEAYWKSTNEIPLDPREAFAADRFCGKDGMSSENLKIFNTLGDLTIYKMLGAGGTENQTWIIDLEEYKKYCAINSIYLEAKVSKDKILFCRDQNGFVEVVVLWEDVNVNRAFYVSFESADEI